MSSITLPTTLSLLAAVLFCATTPPAARNDVPTMVSTAMETTYTEQGKKTWQMKTPKMLQYDNADLAFPEGLVITGFEKEQADTIAWTARANEVYFNAKQGLYELRGDVVIQSVREQRQLSTTQLFWNTSKEELYTEQYIKIEGENETITGQGLTARQDLSQYHIAKPEGLLNIAEEASKKTGTQQPSKTTPIPQAP